MSRTVFLARHAHTGWNEAGRYLGRSDVDLDALGRAQAERLSAWAAGAAVDAVVSSSALRAARTAAAVGDRLGLEVRLDDRLRELDFGLAEGRTLAELRAADPAMVARFETDPAANPFPGGEAPPAALTRLRAALDELLTGPSVRPLIVTHNTLLRLFLCDALGVPLADYRRRLPLVEHCALTELAVTPGGLALRRFNAPPAYGAQPPVPPTESASADRTGEARR